MPPARVAPGPAHPERGAPIPRRCSRYLARLVDRAAIVFLIQICPSPLPTRRAMVPTSSKSRGTHTARTRRRAPASLVPAGGRMRSGRSTRRSGGAFGGARSVGVACGEQEGRSRTPHVDRDDCDYYKYQHDGDTNGGRWRGGREGSRTAHAPASLLAFGFAGFTAVGLRFPSGRGEGADVGVGAGVGLKVLGKSS
ncbi:hypothetical protein B0H14DRAFT_1708711 [Mycena olivaceomarginata]|nr:hypothetical protein B0H14DRAFT_1708711 [Mycena olivaceomarginata]